ncbi:MAG TPA: NrfD/PsrC family molybdoenzyme membrane anchor subunit [Gemmatimonadaceae bacterium]|nr:NrfD/PsrC family molybdoenzyme membrane anchor subunit [Gemmatimonadaceae bacterium]
MTAARVELDVLQTADEAFPRPPEFPVLHFDGTDRALTDQLLAPLRGSGRVWWSLFALCGLGTAVFVFCIWYTVAKGIGTWGNNIPVAWAFAITDFVWWIGIGHAGTFISAFLLLLNQHWRTSINRVAEAMTIFALVNAGIFPILHLGRPWFFYWLIPYPSTMGVWPNFKSALPWDVAAVTTYFTVSLLFWYAGLVPDLATVRDHETSLLRRRIYGLFALGWRGASVEWRQHRIAMVILAGLATPLVVSVHSVVSLDFSIAQLPGWHSTIFPPYFVVGAIYSGFAMVMLLILPLRRAYGLENVITKRHLDAMAKLTLVMALMLTYAYGVELFAAWYSRDPSERFTYLVERPTGGYALLYWIMITCNVVVPQVLWWKKYRTSVKVLCAASAAILLGMWLERFIIIVASLDRSFLPSSWHLYRPTWVDLGLIFGSIAQFGLLFLLFVRFVPFVAISEVKRLRHDLAVNGEREIGLPHA